MDIQSIIDSVETSLTLKKFKTREEALMAHIYKSKLCTFSMKNIREKLNNFNPDRLQKKASQAYPKTDRPRRQQDLDSVKYHRNLIKKNKIQPIWILHAANKYYLLDGAHRIVANYIENKKNIPAYIIKI
jgi:hypothetical protein